MSVTVPRIPQIDQPVAYADNGLRLLFGSILCAAAVSVLGISAAFYWLLGA